MSTRRSWRRCSAAPPQPLERGRTQSGKSVVDQVAVLAGSLIRPAGCATAPDAAWVTRQARQVSRTLQDGEVAARSLSHDRDGTFPAGCDAVFRATSWAACCASTSERRHSARAGRHGSPTRQRFSNGTRPTAIVLPVGGYRKRVLIFVATVITIAWRLRRSTSLAPMLR